MLAGSWVKGICLTGVLGVWHGDLGWGQYHWMSAVLIHWQARVTAGWREPNANVPSSAEASHLLENSISVPESSTVQELWLFFSWFYFLFFSKNSCRCPLPGVVLLQSLFKTRKHRSAGINCPDCWLIQCSHQNLLHMTTTSNGQISVCLFLRVGIYAADLALFTSHSQDFQNYLNCS